MSIPAQPPAPFERRKITIRHTEDESAEIMATCLGNWAYHPLPTDIAVFNHYFLSISHIPSGMTIRGAVTRNTPPTLAIMREAVTTLHQHYPYSLEQMAGDSKVNAIMRSFAEGLIERLEAESACLPDDWDIFEDFVGVQDASGE